MFSPKFISNSNDLAQLEYDLHTAHPDNVRETRIGSFGSRHGNILTIYVIKKLGRPLCASLA